LLQHFKSGFAAHPDLPGGKTINTQGLAYTTCPIFATNLVTKFLDEQQKNKHFSNSKDCFK